MRDDYHPKRNQARQKLATLPQNRFKDLASDVYVQLERQFPSLMEMFPVRYCVLFSMLEPCHIMALAVKLISCVAFCMEHEKSLSNSFYLFFVMHSMCILLHDEKKKIQINEPSSLPRSCF